MYPVQGRPYCLRHEAAGVDGATEGFCCPARIEARRVATGEDGRVKRLGREEEEDETGRRAR